jgi:hypothetical protein
MRKLWVGYNAWHYIESCYRALCRKKSSEKSEVEMQKITVSSASESVTLPHSDANGINNPGNFSVENPLLRNNKPAANEIRTEVDKRSKEIDKRKKMICSTTL